MSPIAIVPLEAWHPPAMAGVEALADCLGLRADAVACARMIAEGLAYAAVERGKAGETRVVGAAGIFTLWPGRAQAWAIVGALPRKAWPAVTVKPAQVLARAHGRGLTRIEASARCDFPAARRWLERLGFQAEARLRAWTPDGADVWGCVHFATSTGG